ncbi:MAG: SET domain-containing protein-lysine N-methyltransferase [Vicinamibacterales bacterium]
MNKVTVISTSVQPRLRLCLVASEPIAAGEPILSWTPDQVGPERTWRTVQVGRGQHARTDLMDYVEHSCRPNARLAIDEMQLVALRAVAAGEAITFFYPGTEVEMAQPFTCTCGSAECLGEIAGAFYLTAAQMRAALAAGYCSSFIEAQLQRLLALQFTV